MAAIYKRWQSIKSECVWLGCASQRVSREFPGRRVLYTFTSMGSKKFVYSTRPGPPRLSAVSAALLRVSLTQFKRWGGITHQRPPGLLRKVPYNMLPPSLRLYTRLRAPSPSPLLASHDRACHMVPL